MSIKYKKVCVLMSLCLFMIFANSSVLADIELEKGARGSRVRELQRDLSEIDLYDGEIDGIFGSETAEAVDEYKKFSESETDSSRKEEVDSRNEISLLRFGDRGEEVARLNDILQQKGFLGQNQGDVFTLQTRLAVELVQDFYDLLVDGIVGPRTWSVLEEKEDFYDTYTVRSGDTLSQLAQKWDISQKELLEINNKDNSDHLRIDEELKVPADIKPEPISAISWQQVDDMFPEEDVIILTDLETGLHLRFYRHGGTYHADSEPYTEKDRNVLQEIYNGKWSWERRAVVAHIDGKHVAASINGVPHGGESIEDNEFPGHICIHFKDSKLHKTEKKGTEHQDMIAKAAQNSWPLGLPVND